MTDFPDVRLKIDRAAKHMDELEEDLRSRIQMNQESGIRLEGDADTWRAVVTLPDTEQADPRWSLLIGEILYQLRSSLDHIINAIVPKVTKDTGFPTRDTEASFDNDTDRQLAGIERHSIDWTVTKELQPFRLMPSSPRDATPWAINELANLDRHRFLHASGLWLSDKTYLWFDPPDGATIDYTMGIPGPLKQGAVVANGRVLDPDVNVNLFADPDLVIESIDEFRGPDMLGIWATGLRRAIDFVRAVVDKYDDPVPFLASIGEPR